MMQRRTANDSLDGPRMTGESGTKWYLPCGNIESSTRVKVRPAHAVPARPVAVNVVGTSTPGSQAPAGQSAPTTCDPQLGTSVMSSSW